MRDIVINYLDDKSQLDIPITIDDIVDELMAELDPCPDDRELRATAYQVISDLIEEDIVFMDENEHLHFNG